MRIRESVQLQTVLAMYEQEIDRDRAMSNYQRVKTMVRIHTGQTIRTRNFRVRNGRIGTGVLVNSLKGKNVSVEMRMGECFQWKANEQCSKGDSCSSCHGNNRGQPAKSSSLAPRTQTQNDGRRLSKGFVYSSEGRKEGVHHLLRSCGRLRSFNVLIFFLACELRVMMSCFGSPLSYS